MRKATPEIEACIFAKIAKAIPQRKLSPTSPVGALDELLREVDDADD